MVTYSVSGLSRREILKLSTVLAGSGVLPSTGLGAAQPEGQLIWGVHVSLAPTWFDPAEKSGTVTPFLVMYALHDAMVKPMPGQPFAPSLCESWTVSENALIYEFLLRDGAKFHESVTADDVKFSFERYRGTLHQLLQDRVAAVEIPDSRRVRFKLKRPWPDFLTFYGSATGAGWVVPRRYLERVGEEGYKKSPVGAGPYRFVSFTPGLDLTLEAFDQYWRKTPSVKRLVFRAIPDEATRLIALKRGEVDIIYAIRGELAEELARTKELTLQPIISKGTH
jgi:peptide/nickel transport system substrate-binding protein